MLRIQIFVRLSMAFGESIITPGGITVTSIKSHTHHTHTHYCHFLEEMIWQRCAFSLKCSQAMQWGYQAQMLVKAKHKPFQ